MNQKTEKMEGILYLTDDQNKKRFVQIDIDKYGSIVEDILDRLTIESRKNEESYSLEEVIKELETKGNLDKYV
jgi:hypothetical protein